MSKNARSSGSENSLGYSHTSFKQHATFSKEFAHIQCTLLCGPMPKPSLRHEELSLVRKNGFGVKSCIPPNHESSEKRCLAFGAPSLVGPGGKHFLNSGGPSDCDKISGYSCVLFKQRAFLIWNVLTCSALSARCCSLSTRQQLTLGMWALGYSAHSILRGNFSQSHSQC